MDPSVSISFPATMLAWSCFLIAFGPLLILFVCLLSFDPILVVLVLFSAFMSTMTTLVASIVNTFLPFAVVWLILGPALSLYARVWILRVYRIVEYRMQSWLHLSGFGKLLPGLALGVGYGFGQVYQLVGKLLIDTHTGPGVLFVGDSNTPLVLDACLLANASSFLAMLLGVALFESQSRQKMLGILSIQYGFTLFGFLTQYLPGIVRITTLGTSILLSCFVFCFFLHLRGKQLIRFDSVMNGSD